MKLTECPEGVMRNGCEVDRMERVMRDGCEVDKMEGVMRLTEGRSGNEEQL